MMEDSQVLVASAELDDSAMADLAGDGVAARRVGVLVMAMHRSGSSAITRMLSLLGCALPATPMPLAFDNPLGHWESQRVADFNDEILGLAGTQWDDWLPVNPQLSETLVWPQLVAQGRAVLRQEFADAPLFVLKDPRLCKLGSLWIDVLAGEAIDAAFVLPLRNPIEVARSLAKRDGIDEHQVLLIWLRHVLAAEAATRGRRRVFTDFAQLLDGWEELSARLSAGLGLVWPRVSALSGAEISTFLTPDLRHHVSTTADLGDNPAISPWVRKAYAVLLGWARRGEQTPDHAILDQISREFDAAGTAFARPMLNGGLAVRRAAQADAERLALAAERDAVAAQLAARDAELVQACAERAALGGDRAALAEACDKVAWRLGEVEAELAQARVERDSLAGDRAALAEARDRVAWRLGEVEAELARARVERDSLAGDRTALAEARDRVAWRLGEVEADFARVQGESDLRTAERDRLAGERAALTEERARVAWRLGEVEAELAQARVERDARAAERDQLAAERGALAEGFNTAAWRLNQFEVELAEAKETHDRTRARVSALADDLAVAHADAEAIKHRLAVTESALRQREEEIAQLGTELEATRLAVAQQVAAAGAARDDGDRLLHQCQSLREAMSAQSANHSAQSSQMQRELAEALTARQMAEDRALQAELSSEALRGQLAERFAELAQLAKLLHARDVEVEAGQVDLTGAQARLENRFHEISVLSRLLRDREHDSNDQNSAIEWLSKTQLALSGTPFWWPLLPKASRRKLELKFLARKHLFDGDAYLARYPDVAAAGMDPLIHYLRHGLSEGRLR